ncbi:MAG: response regulator [Candidatus Nitrosomaritimum aestuariumsis]|jgi:two-component system chemotaxis response regulator CheY/two-component system response regulator (stage 0 sporulation protein A)|uniref:Response regulator n=1 Tax=Candidatus Nitrosomaritimum aestuariumsis TaxID=3342354 RepID=A0AC60VZV8_9ARCH|nr:response regulator [Nitrosopumilaceae archaeon]
MIRAVVVDDDKDTVALFSEILSGNNIEIVGKGYNGQEAAFLYQKLKPDVIFLDVIMPVYDGIYGITKIREMNPDAIVIITTNQMTINAQIALNKLRPSAIIKEPIDVDEIIKKVNQLCAPSLDSENQMKKTMVTLALKNTLLELGIQEYDKVISLLQKDHSCTLEDCFENPEYLRNILKDLFGESYPDILNSLSENMKSIISQQEVKEFFQVLSS